MNSMSLGCFKCQHHLLTYTLEINLISESHYMNYLNL